MKRKRDEEIESCSEVESDYESNDYDDESEHQNKVKLSKQYIKEIKEKMKERKVENVDEEVKKTLLEEALEKQGKVMKIISDNCKIPEKYKTKLYKNKNFVTCFAYSIDGKYIFTGNKCGQLIKWNVSTGQIEVKIKGGRRFSDHPYHKSRITSIAVNEEFVVSGDLEKKIFVWSLDLEHKKTLKKHSAEITSLAFRRNTQQLFSGDRKGVIFVWDLTLMNTIEELIGHTSPIMEVDSNLSNVCLSCSSIADPCVKLWKLDKESMISYTLPKKDYELSLDCVSMINDRYFLAGSFNNKIYLWDGVNKKSPICVVSPAHDLPTDKKLVTGNDINVVSIRALKHSNVFASGSNMSQVKVWSLVDGKGDSIDIQLLFVMPNIVGCINSLQWSPDGKDLAVAVSECHKRLSMQKRCPGAKGAVIIFNVFK